MHIFSFTFFVIAKQLYLKCCSYEIKIKDWGNIFKVLCDEFKGLMPIYNYIESNIYYYF